METTLPSFQLSDRERGYLFLEDIDLEAQLAAVRSLLRRNHQADAELKNEIDQLAAEVKAASEDQAWIVEDMWIGQMEHSVYHDAANSMAAVGMLAPMFEALFANLFRALGRSHAAAQSDRTDRARRADEQYWDPHLVFDSKGRREDLVAGILQLSADTKLTPLLPKDLGNVLTALFAYRNMMFHNGFEWPVERRTAFAALLKNQGIPDTWFSNSSRGDQPWIYYMSPAFVDRCLKLVDEALAAIGSLTNTKSKAIG
jgi:hypothetical protein